MANWLWVAKRVWVGMNLETKRRTSKLGGVAGYVEMYQLWVYKRVLTM